MLIDKPLENTTTPDTSNLENEGVMKCHAFIVHLFFRKYMLHIWTSPYRKVAWHRKRDNLPGKFCLY